MSQSIVNCDWGTTRFRLRAITVEPLRVEAESRSLEGVGTLAELPAELRPDRYRQVLAAGLEALIASVGSSLAAAPILVSGMASSTIGWQELPYARLPLPLDGSTLITCRLPPLESSVGSHEVLLVSGACTDRDVMRGEETEVLGLFQLPAAQLLVNDSLVIKPGTHSKHLRVRQGQVVGLQTFMTGELFDILSQHGILRHSLGEVTQPAGKLTDALTADFRAGVDHGRTLPLAGALFRIRTRQVLDGQSGPANRAFLSGVLVGSELAYLAQESSADPALVLCATSPQDGYYLTALDQLGLSSRLTVIAPEEIELLSARGQALLWMHARSL